MKFTLVLNQHFDFPVLFTIKFSCFLFHVKLPRFFAEICPPISNEFFLFFNEIFPIDFQTKFFGFSFRINISLFSLCRLAFVILEFHPLAFIVLDSTCLLFTYKLEGNKDESTFRGQNING